MKAKRLCADAVFNHLKQGVENDRFILAAQWVRGFIDTRIKSRYDNNIRKLNKYESDFLNAN